MRSLKLVFISLVGLASSGLPQVHADEPWNFAQVTCVPELGYFSIRKILIMNVPHKGPYLSEGRHPLPNAVSALQSKYQIFDSDGLRARPFTCTSPDLAAVLGWEREREGFDVKVIGHIES